MKHLHALITVMMTCLASISAWAIDDGNMEIASPDDARYRIELLLFANSNPADETVEQWFPPRTLPVPENLQTLMPALPETVTEAPDTAAGASLAPVDTQAMETGQDKTPPAKRIEPFTELTDISPDFEQAADRMRRSRYYRVLKLTAWEQALPQGAEPVAVVIRGGELFGQHHELEGTISLRRERYLHAHARLWLSRFTEYTGQSSEEDWPALPLLPTPPEPAILLAEDAVIAADSHADGESDDSTDTTAQQDGIEVADGPADDVMPYDEWAEYDWFAPARPDRIVLMNQSRRLRSNELHYIDHPLFGMILRIVPVEVNDATDAPE